MAQTFNNRSKGEAMIASNPHRAPIARARRGVFQTLVRVLAPLLAFIMVLGSAVLSPAAAAALDDPNIAATAVLLVDAETGVTLYEQNADEQRYPASITKIMTALVVLEHADLNTLVTVEEADFASLTADSSVAGFQAGEQLTVEQLLYGLLLPSGNDAAYILARAVGGSVEGFVQMMNDKAAELGCTGTHFANPCGLHDDTHYTTARDIYRMMDAAMENETFAQIVRSESYDLPATNLQDARTIYNSNYLLRTTSSAYYEPAIGVKTGNTTEAGRCLAAAAEQNGTTLYAVVLGCETGTGSVPESITETRRLFEWAADGFAQTELAAAGAELTTCEVIDADGGEELSVVPATDLTRLLPLDADPAAIEVSYDLLDDITAPVEAGTAIGSATYSYQGQELGTVEVEAGNDVAIAPLAFARNLALGAVLNPIFWVVAVVLIIVIVVANASAHREARARRNAHRARVEAVRGRGGRPSVGRGRTRSGRYRTPAPGGTKKLGKAQSGARADGTNAGKKSGSHFRR